VVKHYLWFSAITSKVTMFTTIETIHILVFFTAVFPTLVFMSTTTCFYSSLAIFGTLTLILFIFRAIYFTHLSLRYESLVYGLLIVKSIFFTLDMTSNIIKCLDVIIVGKVNIHVFSIAWQRADNSLDLLFISHLMPNTP
jgi:hypothetical protein